MKLATQQKRAKGQPVDPFGFPLGRDIVVELQRPDRLSRLGLAEAIHGLAIKRPEGSELEVPQQEFTRVPLYPKQCDIVDDPARFTITEASTKAGKTMSHIEWILEAGINRGYGNSWWVGPVSSQADIAFRRSVLRLKGFIDSGNGPRRVADPIPYDVNKSDKWIEVGGCRFWFKSADRPDSLYGEDVYDLVGDEVTRWKEESWIACVTTLTATAGRAKLIGNVKGRKNFAYVLARKAESGAEGWAHHKLTAYDAIAGGVISKDAVEDARRTLPELAFQELFLAEPGDDQSNPFGLEHIRACIIAELSTEEPIAYGWDLAKSVDYTVGTALDEDGQMCRFARFQKPWNDTKTEIRNRTKRVPALVDSTGVGDPILEDLQKGKGKNFVGYKFTNTSKQQLMEGLAIEIQQHGIGILDGVTVQELEDFEYEYTRTGVRYSAPEGLHDDTVMALALAVASWRSRARRPRLRAWYPGMEEEAAEAAAAANGKNGKNGNHPNGNGTENGNGAKPRRTRFVRPEAL